MQTMVTPKIYAHTHFPLALSQVPVAASHIFYVGILSHTRPKSYVAEKCSRPFLW